MGNKTINQTLITLAKCMFNIIVKYGPINGFSGLDLDWSRTSPRCTRGTLSLLRKSRVLRAKFVLQES